MYKKIMKGVASVLGAALVLCAAVTSVVPAKAATTAKVGNGYETSYALSELEIAYWPENATLTGNQIVYDKRYQNCIFKIPQAVLDAGFTAYYIDGSSTGDAGLDMKITVTDSWWNTDKVVDNYNGAYSRDTATQANAAWAPDAITLMSLGEADNVSITTTVKGVVFITTNAVAGIDAPAAGNDDTDDGDATDDGDEAAPADDGEDAAPADDGASSKTGESLTNLYVVCALGGLFLLAAAGTFVTEQKKRR